MRAKTDLAGPAPRELGEAAQRRLALVFTAGLAGLATVLLVLAPALIPGQREGMPYHQSPTMFPMAALAIVAGGAMWHALRLARGASLDNDDIEEPSANWPAVLAAFAAYTGYVLAMPLLGYLVATVLFVLVLGMVAGMGWRRPLVIGGVVGSVLFGVFVLALHVSLPASALLGAR